MTKRRALGPAVFLGLLFALPSCSRAAESAIFRNPCRVPVTISTYGDASGGPHGEPMGGGTIQAGSSRQISSPFTYGDEVAKSSDSALRSVHVEPSGVDFLVGDDSVAKDSNAFSYAEYDVTIPVSACPKS